MNATPHDASEPVPDLTALWDEHGRRTRDVAYRMLGSLTEAEDVAAEAFARLAAADIDGIDDPRGWLVTVAARLAIDRLRSADLSRRAYVGPWLPEPIISVADTDPDPADRVTLDDTVRMALLVVLQQLTPAERTAFVLHDVFGLTFDEVATVVGRSPAACRQLASRARRRIRDNPERPRAAIDRSELERVATRFADACTTGSMAALLEVLDPNVVGDFDSGGLVPGAPLRAVTGAERVARVLVRSFAGDGFGFAVEGVNGEPGVTVRRGQVLVAVIAIVPDAGRIRTLHGIGNPAKLHHLT